MVLEKTLESPLDCKKIQPVHSERDQSGVFIGRTDVEYIMRNVNTSWNQDDTTLMAESEEELKSLLMKVKEESEKVGLKLNIQTAKIMASGPITSWEIDGETMETVSDFIFLGSKITADGDCCHEIKRGLLVGRKAITNLDNMSLSKLRELVIDREAWRAAVHGVTKSRTRLSD